MKVKSVTKLGDRLVVVFDGHCGLCNRAVRWLLRHDGRDRLRFVASESAAAAGLLARHGISASGLKSGPETILVVRKAAEGGEQVLARSEAVLALLRQMPRPWPGVAAALGWIPRPARELGYRLIARWRYRIWGRVESCPLPTANERQRFL